MRLRPPICQRHVRPGLHREAPALGGGLELLDLVHRQRPRADEAHLAAEDVPELRQLIERGFPQESADRRDARILVHLENRPSIWFIRCSSSRCISASVTIVRNLSIVNGRPFFPPRAWRKMTGPLLAQRESAIAMARNSHEKRIRTSSATTRSNRCLIISVQETLGAARSTSMGRSPKASKSGRAMLVRRKSAAEPRLHAFDLAGGDVFVEAAELRVIGDEHHAARRRGRAAHR